MVFDKQAWVDVKGILRKILHLIREWRLLFKEDRELEMTWSSSLEGLIRAPLKIKSG
jgi:hypothetical protein